MHAVANLSLPSFPLPTESLLTGLSADGCKCVNHVFAIPVNHVTLDNKTILIELGFGGSLGVVFG